MICGAFPHLGSFRLVYNFNFTFTVFTCDFLRRSVRESVRESVKGQLTQAGVSVLSKPQNWF